MARGRMINKTLARSRKFQKLESDFDRLLYCMILPFLDRDGRAEADPLLIKADSFPLRGDITIDDIETGLKSLDAVGLIQLYTVDGEQYLQCVGFADNQAGMSYGKEAESRIPAPADCEVSGDSEPEDDQDPEPPAAAIPEPPQTSAGVVQELRRSDAGVSPPEKEKEKKEKSNKIARGAPVRVGDAVERWNQDKQFPPCKYAVIQNMPEIREVLIKFDTFTDEEINQAIDNLSKFWPQIPKQYRPRSFQKFITRSLDDWLSSARPWERFEPDAGESQKPKRSEVPAWKPPEDSRPEATEEEAAEAFAVMKGLTGRKVEPAQINEADRRAVLHTQAEQLKREAV